MAMIRVGDKIRLDSWEERFLQVIDIGMFSVIGNIVDKNNNNTIVRNYINKIDLPWIHIEKFPLVKFKKKAKRKQKNFFM